MEGRRKAMLFVVFLVAIVAATVATVATRSNRDPKPDDAALLRNLAVEYDDGGLFQFFWNTRGKDNEATLAALKRRGDSRHAELFRTAVAAFDAELPTFQSSWQSFDSKHDVAVYSATVAHSSIPSLDREWAALPPLAP